MRATVALMLGLLVGAVAALILSVRGLFSRLVVLEQRDDA